MEPSELKHELQSFLKIPLSSLVTAILDCNAFFNQETTYDTYYNLSLKSNQKMLFIYLMFPLITLARAANGEYKHIMPSGIHLNLANEYKIINDHLTSVVPNDEANSNMAVILEWLKSDDMDFFNNIPLQEALLVFSSLLETVDEGSNLKCSQRSSDIIGENQQWISEMARRSNFNTKSRIEAVFEQFARKHFENCMK